MVPTIHPKKTTFLYRMNNDRRAADGRLSCYLGIHPVIGSSRGGCGRHAPPQEGLGAYPEAASTKTSRASRQGRGTPRPPLKI